MRSPLNVLSVVTATLLFFQSSPLPLSGTAGGISGAIAQEQAVPDGRQSAITQLLVEGYKAAYQKVFQEALQKFEQALAISKEIGDRKNEAIALRNMAVIYRKAGEYNQALELFDRAFDINRDSDILISMGNIYLKLGDRERGIEFYQQAFQISAPYKKPYILTGIGNIYLESGDRQRGIEFYQQAFEINRDPAISTDIGEIYLESSEYEQAIEFYQKALAIYQEYKNCSFQSDLLNKIGKVYEIQGQNERAREFYRQAIKVIENPNKQCQSPPVPFPIPQGIVLRDDDDQPRQRPTQASQDK